MTLIELLVVIVILTIVVAAAIPILAPTSSERQLREAARGLNAFITGAQARAVANGRPFGFAIKRLSQDTDRGVRGQPNDNGVALEVYMVEQQPPYAGFDAFARARVAEGPSGSGEVHIQFVRAAVPDVTPPANDRLPPGYDADNFPPGIIRPGDVVEIGGTLYQLQGGVGVAFDAQQFFAPMVGALIPATFIVQVTNNNGQLIQPEYDNTGQRLADPPLAAFTPPYWTEPAPYKIFRQPVPTSDEPYQLPDATVVDLRASGIGDNQFFYWPGTTTAPPTVDNPDGIIVLFAPEGRVSRVYFNRAPTPGPAEQLVTDNIYLHVGPNVVHRPVGEDDTLDAAKWNAAQSPADKAALREPINWLRGESQWIVIGARSGRIVTVENSLVDPAAAEFSVLTDPEQKRTAQILAARQITREMSQLGGR